VVVMGMIAFDVGSRFACYRHGGSLALPVA